MIRGFYVRIIHFHCYSVNWTISRTELILPINSSLKSNWFWTDCRKQNSNSSVLHKLSFQGIQRSTFLHLRWHLNSLLALLLALLFLCLRQHLDRCSHNPIIVGITSSIDVLSSWYHCSRVSTQRDGACCFTQITLNAAAYLLRYLRWDVFHETSKGRISIQDIRQRCCRRQKKNG